MPEDEFKSTYPDAKPISWEPGNLDDKDQAWYAKDEVRVAEYWVREPVAKQIYMLSSGDIVSEETYTELEQEYIALGITVEGERETTSYKVTQYIVNAEEILETNQWPGKYIPIIPVYGEEVYHDGERHFYGLIHFAKDSQMMYNYWRTTTTELVALAPKAPYIGPVGRVQY